MRKSSIANILKWNQMEIKSSTKSMCCLFIDPIISLLKFINKGFSHSPQMATEWVFARPPTHLSCFSPTQVYFEHAREGTHNFSIASFPMREGNAI